MNIFLGLILLLLCIIVSYFLTDKFTEKRKFYQEFFDFNNLIKSEVNFQSKTLDKIIFDKNTFFYNEMKKSLKDETYLIKNKNYTDEEKTYFKDYCFGLGKSDKNTQLAFLESFDKGIKDKLDESIAIEKKNKSLYLKIGIAFGIILFIAVL